MISLIASVALSLAIVSPAAAASGFHEPVQAKRCLLAAAARLPSLPGGEIVEARLSVAAGDVGDLAAALAAVAAGEPSLAFGLQDRYGVIGDIPPTLWREEPAVREAAFRDLIRDHIVATGAAAVATLSLRAGALSATYRSICLNARADGVIVHSTELVR